MSLSYDEAVAAVTAPGQRYETDEVVIDGITQTVFTNVPPEPARAVRHLGRRGATPPSSSTRTSG